MEKRILILLVIVITSIAIGLYFLLNGEVKEITFKEIEQSEFESDSKMKK
jgi:Tfp pilus assembly protein PilO